MLICPRTEPFPLLLDICTHHSDLTSPMRSATATLYRLSLDSPASCVIFPTTAQGTHCVFRTPQLDGESNTLSLQWLSRLSLSQPLAGVRPPGALMSHYRAAAAQVTDMAWLSGSSTCLATSYLYQILWNMELNTRSQDQVSLGKTIQR